MKSILKFLSCCIIFTSSLSLAASLSAPEVNYIHYDYPADHWAINPDKDGTSIVYVSYRNTFKYLIQLNPTDRRGYRVIVRYVGQNNQDIRTTLNRPYTSMEERGLLEVSTFMMQVYKRIGLPIVQIALAGNNAQSYDKDNRIIHIGTTNEPGFLHLHMWARGAVDEEYIPGVSLLGPELGETFDMSNGKVKWDKAQIELCLPVFRKAIANEIANNP